MNTNFIKEEKFRSDIINPRSIPSPDQQEILFNSQGSFSSEQPINGLVSSNESVSSIHSDVSSLIYDSEASNSQFNVLLETLMNLRGEDTIMVERDPTNSDLFVFNVTYQPPSEDSIRFSYDKDDLLYNVYFEPEGNNIPDYIRTFLISIDFDDSEIEKIIYKMQDILHERDITESKSFSVDGFLSRIASLNDNQIILLSPSDNNDFELRTTTENVDGIRLSKNPKHELYHVYIKKDIDDLNYLRAFIIAIGLEDKVNMFIKAIQRLQE